MLGVFREDAMHPEADALLDAIFDAPGDDTPRLVYADWLQEHGQEDYAQFIRLQCAAARHPVWSDEANDLWVKIGRVWNRLADEWWPATAEPWLLPSVEHQWTPRGLVAMPTLVEELLDAVHFDRGMLRPSIPVSTAQMLRYPGCWAFLPSPGSPLLVSPNDGSLDAVATLPRLSRVRTLRALIGSGEWDGYRLEPEILNQLLRSPHLRRVTYLDLSQVWLTRSTVDLLLTAPHLVSVQNVEAAFDSQSCDPVEATMQLKSRFKRVVRY